MPKAQILFNGQSDFGSVGQKISARFARHIFITLAKFSGRFAPATDCFWESAVAIFNSIFLRKTVLFLSICSGNIQILFKQNFLGASRPKLIVFQCPQWQYSLH